MSTLNIAAIQLDIGWLNKKANLLKLEQLLKTISQVDLLLLPETFSTGFSIDVDGCEEPQSGGIVLEWMQQKASELNAVVAGSVLVKQQNKKVNRFYWVSPDGHFEYYDKRHLFRLGNEQEYVLAGQERKIITINQVRILPTVCYDLRFPVWSRNRQDYDLMVNVANWPAVRRNVWDTLLKARAMENQSFVIGVNRVGDDGNSVAHSGGTAIYNYLGETVASSIDNQEQVLQVTLDFSTLEQFKQKFPAYLDADDFEIKM